MRLPPDAKLYELRPLTGPLDPQSSPDAVLAGGHRWVQNWRINSGGALARAEGFNRLLKSDVSNNNADLHNQLENTVSGAADEEVSLLFSANSATGVNKLLAGTTSRLYAFNSQTDNWKLIGEALAAAGKWKAAQLGDAVILINENTDPVYYNYDQPKELGSKNSVREIDSFKELGLHRVKHIKEWRGLMFYANVHEGNEWVSDRIVWSDFKKPFEITPNVGDSLAGYQDLGQGEDIIGMEPLSNMLLIYTVRGVWQFEVAGGAGTDVLSFRKRYSDDETGNAVPNYPNTIVSSGAHHFYLGRDGVYTYNAYRQQPDKPDWLHLASGVIFDDINKDECALPIAAFNSRTDEVWISWPSAGATKNDKTLIINTKHKHVSYIDTGFTAFTNFVNESYTSIGNWMQTTHCICKPSEVAGFRESTEGASVCTGSEDFGPDTVCTPAVTELYTTATKTYSDIGFPSSSDDLITEDWTAASATGTSLHASLGTTNFADLCITSCPDPVRFVMAWADDDCLKEDGTVYFREKCVNKTGCGIYDEVGYNSILTSPALRLNDPTKDKLLRALTLEFVHQQTGGKIHLRVGTSAQAVDPNKIGRPGIPVWRDTDPNRCGLLWRKQEPKDIECVWKRSALEETMERVYENYGIRASEELTWPLFEQGRNIYYEISVNGTLGAFEATAIRLYASTKKA